MENRTFIMGDIHGMYDKLMACLQAVSFDYTNDTLIQLGDVVDRGPDSYLVVEELLKIKNLIAIRGNHDDCWVNGLFMYKEDYQNQADVFLLYNQGARETLQSYTRRGINPMNHIDFFNIQVPYYIDKNNNCFVHGGFNRHTIIENQIHNDLLWDRDLWHAARSYDQMRNTEQHPFKNKNKFQEIFIGHTPTTHFDSKEPLKAANIWNIDTGCGKGGLLTIMNLETKEYKQF